MLPNDPLRRVLYIDLTKRRSWAEDRHDLFEQWLGGAGVAAVLLAEECPQGADPLGPDNPIVLAVGPLTGLFPLASKTVAMFKSPHTGNLGESHSGGRSAVAIRLAGYGAIVIRGASDGPVYISVHDGGVRFHDASSLWGVRSSYTVARLLRQRESGAGLRTIMRIGRAGEERVAYACVTTETYRHFGRLGLGAVFGAKKLKAVVVSGRRVLPVADGKAYRCTYDAIYEAAVNSPVMKKYHDLGTAENIAPLSKLKGLPTRNLKEASFAAAQAISGEALAQEKLGRRIACSHCPVACIHLAALREPSAHEPYFYKTSMICYDYEPIYAMGTMLGVADPDGMLKLLDAVEVYGLDAMSTGVVLAWATEAMEQKLIGPDDTGGLALAWGGWAGYLQAVRAIVDQPTECFRVLARGVDAAAERYGGEDFALAFGQNEMPGYHTGAAGHVGYLIGARHSHLDNAGYSLDQRAYADGESPMPEAVAQSLLKEERWRQVLSSLAICFFARGIYKPEMVVKSLASAGFDLTEDALNALGKAIHESKFAFKRREGFSLNDLRLPGRIFETPALGGATISESFVRDTLRCFGQALAGGE